VGLDWYHGLVWGVTFSGYVFTIDIGSGSVGNVTSFGGGQYDIIPNGVYGEANVLWETDYKNNSMRRLSLF